MEIRSILVDALNHVGKVLKLTPPKSDIELSTLRWELYSVFQNILDATAMIVADLGLRKPNSYVDLGIVLYEAGLVDERVRDDVKRIALIWNTIAHAYRKISLKDLVEIVENIVPIARSVVEKLMNPEEVRGDVEELRRRLSSIFNSRGVVLAYLFGSRVRGAHRGGSDYDIAVLFEKEDVSIMDEVELGIEVAEELKIPVDRVDVVTLNRVDLMLVARILREDIPIYVKNRDFLRMWERWKYLEILRSTDLYGVYMSRVSRKMRR